MQIKKAASFVTGLALVQTSVAIWPIEFGWPLIGAVVGSVLKRDLIDARPARGPAGHSDRSDIPSIEGRAAVNSGSEAEAVFLTRSDNDIAARDTESSTLAEKRQSCPRAPNGVPQNVVDNCCNAIRGKTVQINSVNTGKSVPDIRVRRIPYPCISATPWLDPVTQGGGTPPFACGDDCLQWTNLNWDQYNRVKALFQAKS
ncbi:hypothetical protein B0H67DRAFT_687931 [Lasiosphaeris hirsuta]|uniref:Uncharacterized protein n=1 Tax=Lasiosphaeris hirsuta TaxID=260670 RepID=A0AA39ZSN3_9PEZI|nr:hypothetical protein B0H67DRAFT_687931 [Lasiosphaeris hirsuta]